MILELHLFWDGGSTCHQWLRPETGAANCRLQTGSQYELSFHLLRSTAYVQYVRRCECDVPITRRLALGRRYSGRIRIFLGRFRSRLIECLGAACGEPPEHTPPDAAAWQGQPWRRVCRARFRRCPWHGSGDHWNGLGA